MKSPSPTATASARGMWIALILVLCLFLVPYGAGLFLGDEFEGAVTTELAAEPQAVWDALYDHRSHPLSGGAVVSVVDLAPTAVGPAWEERMERAALRVETLVAEPPRRLSRRAHDEANGVESTWTYALEATEAGTALRIHQEMRVTNPGFSAPYFRLAVEVLDFARQAPRDAVLSIADGLGLPEPVVVPAD